MSRPATLNMVIMIGLVAGCRAASPGPVVDPSMARLLGIHTAYSQYVASAGKAPEKIADLESTQPEMDRAALDESFRSPHDGQPYVIVWGLLVRPERPPPPVVLAYEKEGVGGKRWVVLTDGACQQMTQSEFEQAPRAKS